MTHSRRVGLPLALICGLAAAGPACRGGVSVVGLTEDGGFVPQGPPVGLELQGVRSDLPVDVNAVVSLRVFALYQDGSRSDETARAVITSSKPEVAQVSGSTLKALAAGQADISARLPSDAGTTLTAQVTITVENPGAAQTVAVEVAPVTLSLAPGIGAQLRANATQADGSQRTVTTQAAWTSQNPAVCTVDDGARKGFVLAVQPGTCVVRASYSGVSGQATVTVTAVTVTSLAVSPAQLIVPKGASGQLIATATLSDGSASDATTTAAWSSADPAVATVSAQGQVAGVATGSTTVTASLGGQTATAQITVEAAPLVALSITPPQATLAAGLSQPLRATAVYGDGATQDVTLAATWASDTPTVATVASGTADAGTVLAVATGRALVKASYGGASGVAVINVSAATLVSLQLFPPAANLSAGTSLRLRAFGTYSDHSVRDVSAGAAWSVKDPAIATVDVTGNLSGLAKGDTTVTAALGAQSATAPVTVTDATLSKILVLPVSVLVPVGQTARLLATGIYSDNTLHDVTQQATWASSQTAIATVSNSAGTRGVVTAAGAGDSDVTASLDGVTSQPCTVTVTAATLLSVQLQLASPLLPQYLTVPSRLTARFSDGSQLDVTPQAFFTVDNAAVASVVASGPGAGTITALNQGQVTITGTYGGKSDSARLLVVDAILQGITVQAPRGHLKVGDSEQLSCIAQYQGAPRGVDVTPLCTWTSSDPAIARFLVLVPGLVSAEAPGSVTVAAELNGVSGTRNLIVDSDAPLKIDVIQNPISLPVGVTRALIAIGTYADGTQTDLTLGVTWTSDQNQVCVVGNTGLLKGLVTGVSGGTAHVIATLGSVSGQSTVNVTEAKAVSLAIAPVNPVVILPGGGPGGPGRGTPLPFYATAHFDDGSDQNVTEASNWSTSDPNVVVISDTPGTKGRSTVVGSGGATVTVVFKGLSASTFLTAR